MKSPFNAHFESIQIEWQWVVDIIFSSLMLHIEERTDIVVDVGISWCTWAFAPVQRDSGIYDIEILKIDVEIPSSQFTLIITDDIEHFGRSSERKEIFSIPQCATSNISFDLSLKKKKPVVWTNQSVNSPHASMTHMKGFSHTRTPRKKRWQSLSTRAHYHIHIPNTWQTMLRAHKYMYYIDFN